MADHAMRVFVLIPFEAEFEKIYDKLIRPAFEDQGHTINKADDFVDQQSILQTIVCEIEAADLVVADLTTRNPNVFYELGLAQALNVPTVLIAQSIDDVPFDLRPYRVIEYSTQFDEAEKLRSELAELASMHSNGDVRFGSPVSDYLPGCERRGRRIGDAGPRAPDRREGVEGNGAVGPDGPAETTSEEEAEAEETARGFLDFLAEGEEDMDLVNEIFEEVGRETELIGEKIAVHGARIEELAEKTTPGTAKQMQLTAALAARDMSDYAAAIERRLPQLEKGVSSLIDGLSFYAEWLQNHNVDNEDQVNEFVNSVRALGEGASEGLSGMRPYRETVAGLLGITRDLDRATKRVTKALDRVIAVMEQVEAFSTRTGAIFDSGTDRGS
jgi:hypothetical protein